jgi:two-component system, sensor histidine kinase RegB
MFHPVTDASPAPPLASAQRRLFWIRAALVGLELCGVWALVALLDARLGGPSTWGLISLHGLLIGAAAWRLYTRRGLTHNEVLTELVADASILAALIYFTGGYANPFISLLLVPLLLAATLLSKRETWAMALWTVVLYSLLAFWYQPLIFALSTNRAIDLHLTGMWLNFIFTVLFVTLALERIVTALRDRERRLAETRERTLRDEHLFLLGMQAASAAHDLATPLAAITLGLDELHREYAGDEELTPPLTRLMRQTHRMQHTLDRLATAAGAARAGEVIPTERFADWIQQLVEYWLLMRPHIPAHLALSADTLAEGASFKASPHAVAVLTTLLNNAADASPHAVRIEAETGAQGWTIRVLDRGAGFNPGDTNDKANGWGVGLLLAHATLARIGGHLQITPRDGGGSCVTLFLPRGA